MAKDIILTILGLLVVILIGFSIVRSSYDEPKIEITRQQVDKCANAILGNDRLYVSGGFIYFDEDNAETIKKLNDRIDNIQEGVEKNTEEINKIYKVIGCLFDR